MASQSRAIRSASGSSSASPSGVCICTSARRRPPESLFVLATLVEIAALGVRATTFPAVSAGDATFLVRVARSRACVARILGRLSDRAIRVPS